jgi:hypothetical protein
VYSLHFRSCAASLWSSETNSGRKRKIRDVREELGQSTDRRAEHRRSVVAGGGLSRGHRRERTGSSREGFLCTGWLDDLVKTVGFRDLSGRLSCVAGIGRDLWDRLDSGKRPKELRPFAPIRGTAHVAPATPGDLLFHIRSERPDLCFEFERILLDSLGACVTVVDEVSGFRYFDARDLLGFVDGTANPTGLDLPADDWDAQMMFFLGRIPERPPQMVCSIAAERLRVFTQPRPILGHGP